jgi:DNA-binding IclR family transcriptional regulator
MPEAAPERNGFDLVTRSQLESHPQFTSTIAHGFDVLRCFSPAEPLLGNKEIAERLGYSRPTVSRLTFTLVALGLLRRDARTGKYQLGPAVLSLGYPLLATLEVRRAAVEEMHRLAIHAGGPVSLGMRDRLQVVYIETMQGRRSNATKPDIGSTRPIYLTAIGRALLHAHGDDDRRLIMRRLADEHPDEWRRAKPSVEASLGELDERGYCIVWGEWRSSLCAVGVPLKHRPDGEPYAFNLTMPTHATDRRQLRNDYAPRLVDMVRNVQQRLGLGG